MIFSVKKFRIVFETISELEISVEQNTCNNMVIFCDFKNSMFKNIIKVLSGFLLILLFNNATIAATGSIEGLVFDKKTGETLVGATVVLEGTTTGAVTDFDGHFIIAGIKPGSYNVKVSYISYNPMVFDNVVVVADKKVQLKVDLEEKIGKKVDLVEYSCVHPLLKEDILKEQLSII